MTSPFTPPPEMVEAAKRAICKSRTCEGFNCCQWPSNMGRTKCPVQDGGYDDAANDAIAVLAPMIAEEAAKECGDEAQRLFDLAAKIENGYPEILESDRKSTAREYSIAAMYLREMQSKLCSKFPSATGGSGS